MLRLLWRRLATPRAKSGQPPHDDDRRREGEREPGEPPGRHRPRERLAGQHLGEHDRERTAAPGRGTTTNRRVMSSSSGLASSAPAVSGSSAIPHFGQLPGPSLHDLGVHRAGVLARPRSRRGWGIGGAGRPRRALEERRRRGGEAALAGDGAEVVGLALVLVAAGRGGRVDAHAADRVHHRDRGVQGGKSFHVEPSARCVALSLDHDTSSGRLRLRPPPARRPGSRGAAGQGQDRDLRRTRPGCDRAGSLGAPRASVSTPDGWDRG